MNSSGPNTAISVSPILHTDFGDSNRFGARKEGGRKEEGRRKGGGRKVGGSGMINGEVDYVDCEYWSVLWRGFLFFGRQGENAAELRYLGIFLR